MEFLQQLEFASDATLLALAGLGCWVVAGLCLLLEHLRVRRRSLDRLERVGWVPWMQLFMGLAVIGGGCLAMSLPIVVGNL